jgi:O-glycosyl hydrolase
MDPSNLNLAFSTDGGVGLSLLRIRIAPCGNDAGEPTPGTPCQETSLEVATAQEAQKLGVKVWATPWSPPPAWKSNDSLDNGGTLLPAYADDWANALVGFVQYMQSNGVSLVGLSAQNEPDQGPGLTYDSCTYTPTALADFIGNNLGPAFQNAGLLAPDGGLPFRIIGPETSAPTAIFGSFSSQILNSDAGAYVGTIATHSYGGDPVPHPEIASAGKEYWETEFYDKVNPADAGIVSGLYVAQNLDVALQAGVNAWHYWWLYNYAGINEGPDQGVNEGLFEEGDGGNGQVPTKRLYAMGNYSRFVRPGFHLVTATSSPANNVSVSAFYDMASTQLVVVSINANPTSTPLTFSFNDVSTGSWTSWVTSATQNLEPGDPVSSPDGGPITYTLQPESVTTLHGLVTGAGPSVELDAGTGPDASVSVNDDPDVGPAAGCGLACSAAGRTSKRGGAGQSVVVGSLLALALSRSRTRRRRERSTISGDPESTADARAMKHLV